ncbi:MAG: CcmD family protein [Anaerolineae bacterium]|nr:CcmD family protein [Anaerolineae bacterium]MCB9130057.1 CcmD family protein [Anaerolineales bacterium]MCB0229182.1 CcmD family protein [Anaerolineae bacterium]MCB0235836.1 CcmD family protein [Anaerolineae bacterium]MCB0237046.1 CcmD family protein [Anaerolineae bacterium]
MVYIAAGMLVFWIATFAFIFSISRRQRTVEEELSVLKESTES